MLLILISSDKEIYDNDTYTLGEEYVLKHNPTGVECKDISRYQPFELHRFQSGCVFQRTQCSESGQVVYHKGSSKVDATCRCNFKEGYAFIKPPKADCSCTPSEEDCSCYFKVCPPDFELKAGNYLFHSLSKIRNHMNNLLNQHCIVHKHHYSIIQHGNMK